MAVEYEGDDNYSYSIPAADQEQIEHREQKIRQSLVLVVRVPWWLREEKGNDLSFGWAGYINP